ncbi:MAG: DoxX family membrane protein [Acidobacteriota bacterium]
MDKAVLAARILLGLAFLVFGLDFFFHVMPMPESMPTEEGMAFLEALMATGYLFQLVKAVEIIGGILLIAGFFVPLALLLLAPVVVNITLYHAVLDTNGLTISLVLLALYLVVAWGYRTAWTPILTPKLRPADG